MFNLFSVFFFYIYLTFPVTWLAFIKTENNSSLCLKIMFCFSSLSDEEQKGGTKQRIGYNPHLNQRFV